MNSDFEYFKYITNRESYSESNMFDDQMVNSEVKKYFGLSLMEMRILLEKCRRENLTETFVADPSGLISFLSNESGFSTNEVALFIANLEFKLSDDKFIIEGAKQMQQSI